MKHERKSTWRPNLFDLVIVALGAAVMAVIQPPVPQPTTSTSVSRVSVKRRLPLESV